MRVVLVRHAKAAPGSPDELRPLTPDGREQARALGQRLREEGLEPDAIVTSPLLRARETAQALGLGDPITDEKLAPGATADDVRAVVRGRGDTVVVVGHQPDCGLIAAELTGREHAFPPAGTATIDLS